MKSFIPVPRDNLEKVWRVPLAPSCLVIEWFIFLVKLTDFTLEFLTIPPSSASLSGNYFNTIPSPMALGLGLTIGGIVIFISVFITLTIIFRWRFGILFMLTGFQVILTTSILTCLETLLVQYWTSGYSSHHSGRRRAILILNCTIAPLLIATSWWTFSAHKSLAMVLAAGGTGWEKANYKSVRRRSTVFLAQPPQVQEQGRILSSCSSLSSDVASIY